MPITSHFSLPPLPTSSPKQPLIYFLSLWIAFFWTLDRNRIIYYVSFCIWLYLFLISSVVFNLKTNKFLLELSVFCPLKLSKIETAFGFEMAVHNSLSPSYRSKNKSSLNEIQVWKSLNLKSRRNFLLQ